MCDLSLEQRARLDAYAEMLLAFNRRINLVSREDEANVRSVHLPHVLSLVTRGFAAGSTIVDWGTGGGLPAVPLAIAIPHVNVHAVDAVEKKVLAVRSMARRLGLDNLIAWHGDAAMWPGRASYSVSRATAPLAALWRWHQRVFVPPNAAVQADEWRPGLVCLKGGRLASELHDLQDSVPESVGSRLGVEVLPLESVLPGDRFSEKVIVHVYLENHGS